MPIAPDNEAALRPPAQIVVRVRILFRSKAARVVLDFLHTHTQKEFYAALLQGSCCIGAGFLRKRIQHAARGIDQD
jgi:hypothetical protein